MPNWCTNRVNVYSENKKDLQKVYDIFADEKSVFGQVIPEPDWESIPVDGEYPKKREIRNPHGDLITIVTEWADGRQDDRWYNWRNQNWGTKWDVAGNVDIEEERWGADGNDELESFEANFETAWAPPEGICARLRQLFPEVHFSWFYDEPGMEVAGYL